MSRTSTLTLLLWLLLGAWLGALAFFGVAVAPAALRHVPSPAAGDLVRAVLGALNWAGVAFGLAIAALGIVLKRGWLATALPIALVAGCLVSQLAVGPALAGLEFGRNENAGADLAMRFRTLHQASVGLYLFTAVGALILCVIHARSRRFGT